MIGPNQFFGGAVDLGTLSDDAVLNTFVGQRVIRVADAAGYSIELPSLIDPPDAGGPQCYVLNEGGTSLDVGGTAIAAGNAAVILYTGAAYVIAEVTIL
jgi:hypothetical protein